MKQKTKTSAAAKNRYNEKVYDRINLTVPKGGKAKIAAHAQAHGDASTNAFICRAINEAMQRDKEKEDE